MAEELEAGVAQRMGELAALYEVSCEILSCLEINHVLPLVTDKTRQLLGGEVAALCLLDEAGQTLNLQTASGPQEALCGTGVSGQHPPATPVLRGDRALPGGVDGCLGSCGIIAAPFRVSHLAAPLRVGGRVIGALCLAGPQAEGFSAEAVSMLTKLANSAAIALENARLYEQAKRGATLKERRRIAAEIHNGLAQTLCYIDIKAERVAELVEAGRNREAASELQHLRAAIGQASREIRRSIASLQESLQPRQALQDRLAKVVDEFAVDGGPSLKLVLRLQNPLFLPPDGTEQVLHVVREALLNAHHHAQAAQVVVHLEQRGPEAVVIVEDDGRGFDPKTPPADGSRHFGLSIMRARAARLGGRVAIDSAPGQGTRVILTWPLNVSG